MEHELTLKIVTAHGGLDPVACQSVHLPLCDGANGHGGGSYGIRHGHVKALFALAHGRVEALAEGKAVLTGQCGGGFASVEDNTVTVVTEHFTRD